MAKKKPMEWSFEEVKVVANQRLEDLISFAESYYEIQATPEWSTWLDVFRHLAEKIGGADEPNLSEQEIRLVWEFAQHLIDGTDAHKKKLRSFWEIFEEIAEIEKAGKGYGTYEPRRRILDKSDEMLRADKVARKVVHAVSEAPTPILEVTGLLLAHQIRVESIEYPIRKTIEDALAEYELSGGFDPWEMCSVENKVKKGDEWRTDVRALRDATAHAWFDIEDEEDEWIVVFDNLTDGYSFERSFSREEFRRFFDLHTLLYKIQLQLVCVQELLPILADRFHAGSA